MKMMTNTPTISNAKKHKKGERGFATMESVILLVVFSVLISYTLGFFGIVHSGIKGSIAARALAFEAFRNRANVTYRRDYMTNSTATETFRSKGYRYSHVLHQDSPSAGSESTVNMWPTTHKIAFAHDVDLQHSGNITGNITQSSLARPESESANPVFIKSLYGICLNANCGD